MKNIRYACLLAICSLAPIVRSIAANAPPSAPEGVDFYATTDIGDGQQCLVGAKSDEDGLNERPIVYLAKAGGGFTWHVQLPIFKGAYQGRATHCLISADALYVLVQTDSDSEQTLNQTMLKVVELSRKTGKVIASMDVGVPNISDTYTSWVDEGNDHFKLDAGKLVIKGKYDLMSERDNSSNSEPKTFIVEVPVDLH